MSVMTEAFQKSTPVPVYSAVGVGYQENLNTRMGKDSRRAKPAIGHLVTRETIALLSMSSVCWSLHIHMENLKLRKGVGDYQITEVERGNKHIMI